jgi:uncharacterized protein (DUF433 family)
MDWEQYIGVDPNILAGKPVFRGTHLSVGFALDLVAHGWREQQILESNSRLIPEALQAMFAFVAERLREETWHPIGA